MQIVKLQAENVKRLRAVEVHPNGSLVVVGGKNGNGKSSLLDSIMMALAGKQALPSKPVRDGEDGATITIELDEDFIITRKIKPDGTSTVEVRSKSGAKYPSPQALLDSFSARFTFDPLKFKAMKPLEQAEILKQILGLDFSEHDRERAAIYEQRTIINRSVRDMEGQIGTMKAHADVPADEVTVAALAEELDAARQQNANRQRMESELSVIDGRRVTTSSRITALRKELEALEAVVPVIVAEYADLKSRYDAQPVVETAALQEKIRTAEETNRKVRENKARRQVVESLALKREESEKLTKWIDSIDEDKKSQLESAAFPVPGMSVDDSAVVLNGIPFDQLSAAEQLRISVAIGLALNPKLKVLLIRDGSLLDEENLKLVAELAEAHGAQVWMERVGDGDEVAVVLEDGSVKEDRTEKQKAKQLVLKG